MKKLRIFTFHSWLFTLLFGVAVLLFFGRVYPHHLHYQEQYQLFLFDSNYVWDIVKLPGGIADLLGRFCTQFFLFAWVGAFIIALLLSLVQLLTLRLLNLQSSIFNVQSSTSNLQSSTFNLQSSTSNLQCSIFNVQSSTSNLQWLYGLSFVPSFLLWLFLLDENALLGGVWAVLLTLLASWLFDMVRPKRSWMRLLLLIVAVPVLYWIVGPVCVLFFLLETLHPLPITSYLSPLTSYLLIFLLLAILPVILSYNLPVPASKLWFGIHYHRYPTVFPVLIWLAALSVFVLTLIPRILHHFIPSIGEGRRDVSFVLVALVMGGLVWQNSNFKAEKVMKYDFMATHQQWNRILETINTEKPNNQIGVTVQNLALAMRGMLTDHLFDYNQNGILGLLPDVESDATSPMPTAEAFYQLGMINVAQRTVFEAQEAILDFQKSGRCYKRLAQTNLINGQYEVARKYLTALQKTLFYSDWANETLPLLGNDEAIAKHPEYGHLRQFAYNEDFYFSDHVTPEMLESLYFGNTDNRLAYEYLKAYYILTDDRENYRKLLLHTSIKQ